MLPKADPKMVQSRGSVDMVPQLGEIAAVRKCRPSKWVPWAFAGAGLPLLAAALISTGGMKSDIEGAAQSALSGSDLTKWATVELTGRVATVVGKTTNPAAVEEVVKVVVATYGVRGVVSAAIVEPLILVAPTVEAPNSALPITELKGTWPEGVAKNLAVTVGASAYTLPGNPELTSSGGNWLLKFAEPLSAGSYDISASASVESDGATVVQATPAPVRIVVAAPAIAEPSTEDAAVIAKLPQAAEPAPDTVTDTAPDTALAPPAEPAKMAVPTVDRLLDLTGAPVIRGTWPKGEGTSLSVGLNGKSYVLGTSANLSEDGPGKWRLLPSAALKDGIYDVVVTAKRGDVEVKDAGLAEIEVDAAHPPAHAEAAPKADGQYDCVATMARIGSVFPMRFVFNRIDFQERFGLSVSQYAALLKDGRCSSVRIEVGGHADERGDDAYNEDLAERRAAKVRDMLVEAGVAAVRLTVASFGESMPIDTTGTEDGWARNRRVEIKILK